MADSARTKLFLDCEFTGLHQGATLISLALVSEHADIFYAEFTDYDPAQIDAWLSANVVANLYLSPEKEKESEKETLACGDRNHVATQLRKWLARFKAVEVWGDALAYDWVLFCELFDAEDKSRRLPSNVYYIPFDLATLFLVFGVDPDISRADFAGFGVSRRHNALDDALAIEACYERIQVVVGSPGW